MQSAFVIITKLIASENYFCKEVFCKNFGRDGKGFAYHLQGSVPGAGSGNSVNRRTLKTEKLLSSSPSRKSALNRGGSEGPGRRFQRGEEETRRGGGGTRGEKEGKQG